MEKQPQDPAYSIHNLVVEADQWKSDLEFYHQESRFLNDLIGGQFVRIVRQENQPTVQRMLVGMKELERKRSVLVSSVAKHLVHLEDTITRPVSINHKAGVDEHFLLKENMGLYVVESRKVKAQVFGILKHVKKSEESGSFSISK